MDYTNPPSITLICGKGGSGKNSLAYKALVNLVDECAAIFVYDKSGQTAHRLGKPWLSTARALIEARPQKWLCFNPHLSFPGEKLPQAFPWFCKHALESAKEAPGRKILFADELWDEVTPHNVPPELLAVINTGRFYGLDFIGITRRPREFPIALRANVTEWILFQVSEAVELEAVGEYFPGAHEAAALPPKGRFVAYNRDTGGILRGGFSTAPGGWSEV